VGAVCLGAMAAQVRAAMPRPSGQVLERFVRIDMMPQNPTGERPGFSAAVPVMVTPLRVMTEQGLHGYRTFFGLPPAGYEFANRRGVYELYPVGGRLPLVAWELTVPPAVRTVLAGVLRQTNPAGYAAAGVDDRLEVLGVGAYGVVGQDLSSVLRIPFTTKSARDRKVAKSFAIAFINGTTSVDASFSVTNAEQMLASWFVKAGLGQQVLYEHFGTAMTAPGSEYLGEVAQTVPDYRKALDVMTARTFTREDNVTFCATFSFREGAANPLRLTRLVRGMLHHTSEGPIGLDYWPHADASGWVALSSFSQPVPQPADVNVRMFLTPLSVFDPTVASPALRCELVRALRTLWIFHGCNDEDIVPAVHEGALRESLLRMTLPMADYLAVGSALNAFEGADMYAGAPPTVRSALEQRYHRLVRLLKRRHGTAPRTRLDDVHRPSYFHPFDEARDHTMAHLVYRSWGLWNLPAEVKAGRATTRRKDHERLLGEILDVVAAGYARSTSDTTWSKSLQSYLGGATAGAYGIADEYAAPPETDLEWISRSMSPIATGDVRNLTLAPLMYPFLALGRLDGGRRFTEFVRSKPGIVAVEGLPLTKRDGMPFLVPFTDAARRVLEAHVLRVVEEARPEPSTDEERADFERGKAKAEREHRDGRTGPAIPLTPGATERVFADEPVFEARGYFFTKIGYHLCALLDALKGHASGKPAFEVVRVVSPVPLTLEGLASFDDTGTKRSAAESSVSTLNDVFAKLCELSDLVVEGRSVGGGGTASVERRRRWGEELSSVLFVAGVDAPRRVLSELVEQGTIDGAACARLLGCVSGEMGHPVKLFRRGPDGRLVEYAPDSAVHSTGVRDDVPLDVVVRRRRYAGPGAARPSPGGWSCRGQATLVDGRSAVSGAGTRPACRRELLRPDVRPPGDDVRRAVAACRRHRRRGCLLRSCRWSLVPVPSWSTRAVTDAPFGGIRVPCAGPAAGATLDRRYRHVRRPSFHDHPQWLVFRCRRRSGDARRTVVLSRPGSSVVVVGRATDVDRRQERDAGRSRGTPYGVHGLPFR